MSFPASARSSPAPASEASQALSLHLARPVLPSLDGLRAIAVLLVVFYHFGIPHVQGGLGVMMFFVISGFLITWLLLKEEERFGRISLRLFYVRRTLRIFPAFYAYWILVVVGLGLVLGQRLVWPQVVTSALYVNNYYQALKGDPNTGLSHTWSLAVEEQFYLLWPLAFVLLEKANRVRAVFWAILIIAAHRFALLQFGVSSGYVYEALDTRADHLLIGCLTALLLRSRPSLPVWARISRNSGYLWFTLLALACSGSLMPAIFGAKYIQYVGYILEPVLIATLLVQAIAFSATSAAWMNATPLRYIGRLSYSIYLYQQIAMAPAKKLLAAYPVWIQFPAALACVLLMAQISYTIIEQPFLKWKERFGRKPSLAL